MALERDAHRFAGDAPAAVAADEISCADTFLGAIAEFDGRGDPAGAIDVAEQGVRELNVHVVEPGQTLE